MATQDLGGSTANEAVWLRKVSTNYRARRNDTAASYPGSLQNRGSTRHPHAIANLDGRGRRPGGIVVESQLMPIVVKYLTVPRYSTVSANREAREDDHLGGGRKVRSITYLDDRVTPDLPAISVRNLYPAVDLQYPRHIEEAPETRIGKAPPHRSEREGPRANLNVVSTSDSEVSPNNDSLSPYEREPRSPG